MIKKIFNKLFEKTPSEIFSECMRESMKNFSLIKEDNMKTIKIIDLLNKMANGEEEVPKRIKYNIFELKRTMSNNLLRLYVDEEGLFFPEYYRGLTLNDEVEILEDEKKIPEKLTDILRVDDLIPPVDENMYKIWEQTIKNQNKVNEILDYLETKGE